MATDDMAWFRLRLCRISGVLHKINCHFLQEMGHVLKRVAERALIAPEFNRCTN
jgi:hypothetical protein